MAELFKIPLVGEELGSSVLYVGPLGLVTLLPTKERASVLRSFLIPDPLTLLTLKPIPIVSSFDI